MSKKTPLVSVIITTKNEESVLERLLISIKNQTYKNTEIIIVDNSSNDATKHIAQKYTKKVFNKGPERSAQRNFGAKKARGSYCLFLDADMKLSKNVISECVSLAESDKDIGAIVIPEESITSNYWERVKAFERSFYTSEGDVSVEAARFFIKTAFFKVGGYDEAITGPEDWDLPESIKKKGFKQKRIKAIISHFERIPNPFYIAEKKYYYALRSHRYIKKQDISTIGPKTVYFLRSTFYKNWRRILSNPKLSLGMFLMLSLELGYGGIGYFWGKLANK